MDSHLHFSQASRLPGLRVLSLFLTFHLNKGLSSPKTSACWPDPPSPVLPWPTHGGAAPCPPFRWLPAAPAARALLLKSNRVWTSARALGSLWVPPLARCGQGTGLGACCAETPAWVTQTSELPALPGPESADIRWGGASHAPVRVVWLVRSPRG